MQQNVAAEIASPAELKEDALARRSLLLIVEHKFYKFLPSDQSAFKAWKALERYFVGKYLPMKVYLENDFNDMRLCPNEKVADFAGRLNDHVDKLHLAGVVVPESRVVDRLLGGVAAVSKFSHLVDTMIGEVSLSPDAVAERLSKVEARVASSGKEMHVGEVAANAADGSGSALPCHKCGKFGHYRKNCPIKGNGELEVHQQVGPVTLHLVFSVV